MRAYKLHWLHPIPYLIASWPRWGDNHQDLAREERRLQLAGCLASLALGMSARAFVCPPEPMSSPASQGSWGFVDTPGVFHALRGQWHAFAAWQAEAEALRLEAIGNPSQQKKAEAKTLYMNAAENLWRSVQELPNSDDNVNDKTQYHSLVQSLAMMLLANFAVKAGLEARSWGGFGTARSMAALAVGQQPGELYLRLEHAEILQLLKDYEAAMGVLAEARGLATDYPWQLQLATKVGVVALASGQTLLLEQAEMDFLRLFLDVDQKDRLIDLLPGDASVAILKANYLVVAGQVIFQLAATARDNLSPGLTVENREQARRAMFRFANAMESIQMVRNEDAKNPERFSDWELNVSGWRQAALDLAGEIALTLGDPRTALEISAERAATDPPHPFAALQAWTDRGLPNRFAAASLITRDPWATGSQIAFRSLSRALASRVQGDQVAMPVLPSPIVIVLNQLEPLDESLAIRILGLSSSSSSSSASDTRSGWFTFSKSKKTVKERTKDQEPTIRHLRERLHECFGFFLPAVLLKTGNEPGESHRISILFHGAQVAVRTPPAGAGIVLRDRLQAQNDGLTVLDDADTPPMLNGNPTAWVVREQRSRSNEALVLEPEFVLIGVLEAAVFQHMHRLIGFDETRTILPNLSEDLLDRGLVVVRQLLSERRPLGRKDASAEITRRLAAGDHPTAVVAHLRALPGLHPMP